ALVLLARILRELHATRHIHTEGLQETDDLGHVVRVEATGHDHLASLDQWARQRPIEARSSATEFTAGALTVQEQAFSAVSSRPRDVLGSADRDRFERFWLDGLELCGRFRPVQLQPANAGRAA